MVETCRFDIIIKNKHHLYNTGYDLTALPPIYLTHRAGMTLVKVPILMIFIVVPCILIILKLFSPTNAHFIEHIKC
jgi:hypothetical protein